MELLGDMGHVESRYGLFGDGVQDSCTVCAKLTLFSEIVLVHLEIMPILTQDRCTVRAEHTIGS